MNLYELTNAYQQLVYLSEETGDDFKLGLDVLDDGIDEKVESLAKVIRTLETKCEAFKNEEDRLATKRRAVENNIKRLKEYIEESLKKTGKQKVQGDLFTVAIQKSPPTLKIDDDKYIPDGYWIPQPPKLDRKELLQDMKLGEEIEGVEIVQGEHVRIR